MLSAHVPRDRMIIGSFNTSGRGEGMVQLWIDVKFGNEDEHLHLIADGSSRISSRVYTEYSYLHFVQLQQLEDVATC